MTTPPPGALLLVGALLLATTACTPLRNPATGAIQFGVASTAEQRRANAPVDRALVAAMGGAFENRALSALVQALGTRLVRASEEPGEAFRFTVLDSGAIAALSLPGGHVYVTRGLVALAADEAELAAVLAAEIGHVLARHVGRQPARAAGDAALATILAGGLFGAGGSGGTPTPPPSWEARFTPEQEAEADRLALRYLARAGFDPRAFASLQARLEAQHALAVAVGGPDPAAYLTSRPRTLQALRQTAAAAASGGGRGDLQAYRAAIDGLPFGDGAGSGGGRGFVDRELGITFEAPPGFELARAGDAITGLGPDGALMVVDSAPNPAESVAAYVEQRWPGRAHVRLTWPGEVDRAPTVAGLALGKLGQQPRQVVFAAIDAGKGRVWRFQFVRPQFGQEAVAEARRSLQSFRRLRADTATAPQSLRLVLRPLRKGETLERLYARSPDLLAQVRLLNDLTGAPPDPGQPLKLLQPGAKSG